MIIGAAPELVLEHSLKNTGKQRIETPVYAHNFFVMDDQPSGPDFLIKVPFDIQEAPDKLGVLKVRGKEIAFLRELENGISRPIPTMGCRVGVFSLRRPPRLI